MCKELSELTFENCILLGVNHEYPPSCVCVGDWVISKGQSRALLSAEQGDFVSPGTGHPGLSAGSGLSTRTASRRRCLSCFLVQGVSWPVFRLPCVGCRERECCSGSRRWGWEACRSDTAHVTDAWLWSDPLAAARFPSDPVPAGGGRRESQEHVGREVRDAH